MHELKIQLECVHISKLSNLKDVHSVSTKSLLQGPFKALDSTRTLREDVRRLCQAFNVTTLLAPSVPTTAGLK